jgi:hypothetical protein
LPRSASPSTYPYRPPLATPQRSLSEMANEQLRRKPRDPLAEGMQSAGDIDCAKAASEQGKQENINDVNTSGLLNVGPLLKRALEGKCRK